MKNFSDYTNYFKQDHYYEDGTPKDFIGMLYFILFDNLLSKIFLLALGVVSGMLFLLCFADLIIFIFKGKWFFEFGKNSCSDSGDY
ncbi:MAG TPA: hypothetical protein PK511_11720 [Chitinophagales bacterium]|nr:hypothetical protein [Cyclobacteriaceae bacterium]HNA14615.1 hypothetical protein [Cyclobacteriaceae bacterium]HNH32150.1 hypothetical protein [bacterium]HNI55184.1 hypothetical protein [Chitinophagales bacterium]